MPAGRDWKLRGAWIFAFNYSDSLVVRQQRFHDFSRLIRRFE